jgi:phosphate transport system substrate-binding protein
MEVRTVRRFLCLTAIIAGTSALVAQHAIKGEFQENLHAKIDPSLVSYKPATTVKGEVRSVGADTMEELTKLWIAGFTKVQPGATFTMEAKASGTAVPALTDGKADIGPCAREVLPPELGPFQKKFGYDPFPVRVASGSYRTPGKTHAIAFLVNKDNPIEKLTFSQLDAIFSTTRKHGAKEDIKTWGQLGLKGEWADKPIALWGLIRPNGIANFIQDRVMANGEYKSGINERTTVGPLAALDAIAQGVAADRYAIGYAGFGNLIPGVKAVALAENDGGPYYKGTFDEVVAHVYPLSRYIYIYVNKAPNKPIEPKTREFLEYILSRDGQDAVVKEGIFLPLSAAAVKQERAKLR